MGVESKGWHGGVNDSDRGVGRLMMGGTKRAGPRAVRFPRVKAVEAILTG